MTTRNDDLLPSHPNRPYSFGPNRVPEHEIVELTDGIITGSKLANLTITAQQIANLTITAAQIANATITAAQIANLTITAAQIDNLTITAGQIANATITGGKIANATITGSNIAAVTISAGNIVAGTITATEIQNATITGAKIASGTITAGNILAATITATEIANATITGGKIAAATITAGNIVAGTITATEIQNATITGAKIAAATIAAGNIVAGTITATEIQNATITGGKIAAGTITASNILAATITATEIQNATITGGKIAATTITAGNIVALTITAAEIANATITGGKIGSATITGGNIASGTITGGNIASGTITGGNIGATTITAGNIASLTITAGQIANLTITASQIANLTITGGASGNIALATLTRDNIVAGTITATEIAATTITAANIAAATITGAKIAAGTITASNIQAGTITATEISAAAILTNSFDVLTANVGQASQNFHMVLRDPDVAHGMTGVVSTDVLGGFGAGDGLAGGLLAAGFSDSTASAMRLEGYNVGASTGNAVMAFAVGKKSGTGTVALAANDLAYAFRNFGTGILRMYGDGLVTIDQQTNSALEINQLSTGPTRRALGIFQGDLTGSLATEAMLIDATWNTSGVATLLKMSLVETASGSGSAFIDCSVGGGSSSVFRLTTSGRMFLGEAIPAPVGIELGNITGTATTPFIDFHAGATAVDYDSRIIARTGTGVDGTGVLELMAGRVDILNCPLNTKQIIVAEDIVNGNPWIRWVWQNAGGTSRSGYLEATQDKLRLYSSTLAAELQSWDFANGTVIIPSGGVQSRVGTSAGVAKHTHVLRDGGSFSTSSASLVTLDSFTLLANAGDLHSLRFRLMGRTSATATTTVVAVTIGAVTLFSFSVAGANANYWIDGDAWGNGGAVGTCTAMCIVNATPQALQRITGNVVNFTLDQTLALKASSNSGVMTVDRWTVEALVQ